MHRAREFFRSRLLALLWLLAAAAANAAPVPSLYAAIVAGSDPQHAAQVAMREVLVRLVGSREAGDDPALAGIVEDAKRYVQIERNTTRGATQVIFDGPALRAAVAAAGRSVWDPDRPLVWVLLPALAGSATDDLRSQLNAAAQVRGLPIALVSAESAGPAADAGNGGAAAVLAAAHRAGAGAALTAQAIRLGSAIAAVDSGGSQCRRSLERRRRGCDRWGHRRAGARLARAGDYARG